MLRLVVNGEPRQVEPGVTLLTALERAGVHVPHLCHDPRLAPVGACRLCVVELRGASRPVAACTTPVVDGMEIETHTPALEHERSTLLRLLAWSYPSDAPVGDNAFLAEVRAHGLEGELKGRTDPDRSDEAHPYIRVDMSRCIYCYRCERICNDLQGQFTWRVWNRGADTRIRPDSGTTLLESSCVSCGACADSCPSGALVDHTLLELGAASTWTRTTCPYCGVGCEMNVGTRNGRLVQVRPVLDAPVNKGHLCVKGRYAFRFGEAADRITTPMIREGDSWRPVTWDEAVQHVADRLKQLRATYGPDSIGVLGSARATNEENYLAQKFARAVVGTNNVDSCARVCHAPSAAALRSMLGTGASTNSFDDIELARTLVVFGSNATENHPVVGARIRQAARRGARLIVVDPRRTELAEIADIHLRLRAGTDIPLLHALAWTLLHEHLVDADFLAARVDGLEEFESFVAPWTPERTAEECGADADLIRRAARMYATEKPSMCFHGLGLTEHVQGTDTVMALVNLALLTGNVGRPGTGLNPLRGQNNVQGAAHMGCDPRHLAGYAPIESGRAQVEAVWGAPIPSSQGLDLMEMMDAARAGRLKALYAIGYDVLLTNPNANETLEALSQLDLLVVQDMFLSETARQVGTVFLPAASSFEKDGTFMNSERRIQRVRRALPPPEGARADWQILCALAAAIGRPHGFTFASAEEIWEEVRRVWKAGAGISYQRIERGGLQWPCPSEDHPGTQILHQGTFASGARAALRRVEYRGAAERPTAQYPFVLVTGRRLYQFNAGTMTGRTLNIVLQPRDELAIAPEDADRLGLQSGDRVVVRSQDGEATISIRVTDEVSPGEVFATFQSGEVFLNRVTSSQRDSVTHTPEYKRTAVDLRRASG
ncbi:MAG TPA: formate dehydrogenase subunit alpha [Myxococcota bacterium]|nr:formate dehydrogenase subunit alpha [Myxococcota bacterium]